MFSVILARPENLENIGLVARAMKNTGFKDLRLTGVKQLGAGAFRTAVHAQDILESAPRFRCLDEAVADLQAVFAATAKARTNFVSMSLEKAVERMLAFAPSAKIGLLFGNERTGLTSEELKHSNFRFMIPQAVRQPSYNLASAVLLTLYRLFTSSPPAEKKTAAPPLSRREQEECIRRIIDILKARSFMHETNQRHVTEMIYDLFGRLVLTDKDRRLLLAVFHKGLD